MRFAFVLVLLTASVAAGAADPQEEYAARAARQEELEKAGARDPGPWLKLADYCEANLLLGRREEALRHALKVDPDNPAAHGRLDEVRSGDRWLPASQAEAEEIAAGLKKKQAYYGSGWIPAGEAEKRRAQDRKIPDWIPQEDTDGKPVARIMDWPFETRVDTPNLAVFSALPLDLTLRISGTLENEIIAYERFYGYGRVWTFTNGFEGFAPFGSRRPVFLFKQRGIFLKQLQVALRCHGDIVESTLLGMYLPEPRALFVGVWEGPWEGQSEEILNTAVHELFHGLDDGFPMRHDGFEMPPWVAEGRAEHFALSLVGRQVVPGAIRVPALSGRPEELSDVLAQAKKKSIRDRKFCLLRQMAGEGCVYPDGYALSWGMVHFLFHGEGGCHAAGFRAYLTGLTKDASVEALEKQIGKLEELEAPFRKYLEEELIPAAFASREQTMASFGPSERLGMARGLLGLAERALSEGAFEAARARFQRALALLEMAKGKEHPDLAPVLDRLAVACHALPERAEEEKAARRRAALIRAKGP